MNLVMMGLGSIIGAGLFVASGIAVRQAGPAVLLVFLVGAVAFYGVLSGLAEMATANPAPGGLRTYAKEALGPWMGFTVGWMYWTSGVLTMSSEVTAAALLANLWLPRVPLWGLSLFFSLLITGINFMDARGFGRVEGALSIIKVVALSLFVLIGGWLVVSGHGSGLLAIRSAASGGGAGLAAGLLPNGFGGLFSSLLMVMVTYAGVQVVAMAAPETTDPPRMVPVAVRRLTVSVVALYLTAFTVLVLLLPTATIKEGRSPFEQALAVLNRPWLSTGLTVVILTAALSALNSSLYSVSRMLRALASDDQAPRVFLRSSPAGLPTWALGGSSLMLMLGVILSFLLPRQAYLLITSASAFVGMFNWTAIIISHMRYRPILLQRSSGQLLYRSPWFPVLPRVTLGIVLTVMASALMNRTQATGFAVGLVQFSLISLIFFLVIRPREAARERAKNPPVPPLPVPAFAPAEVSDELVDGDRVRT
jgi:AAT family amino acid transporter/GABA permease/proline-specific permease ProY